MARFRSDKTGFIQKLDNQMQDKRLFLKLPINPLEVKISCLKRLFQKNFPDIVHQFFPTLIF